MAWLTNIQGPGSVILDPLTLAERQAIPQMSISPSADGLYLLGGDQERVGSYLFALSGSTFTLTSPEPVVAATSLLWSNRGHTLAFTQLDSGGESGDVVVFDPGTRESRVLGQGLAFAWSPDDRYLAVAYNETHEKLTPAFAIYEVSTGKALIRVTGSHPSAWTDEDTIAFTGNFCDTFDAFTVDATSTNLRQITTDEYEGYVISVSPDRRWLIYGENTERLNLVDLASGNRRQVPIGGLSLLGLQWSGDGRFVVLHAPPGKSGSCLGPPERVGALATKIEILP